MTTAYPTKDLKGNKWAKVQSTVLPDKPAKDFNEWSKLISKTVNDILLSKPQ